MPRNKAKSSYELASKSWLGMVASFECVDRGLLLGMDFTTPEATKQFRAILFRLWTYSRMDAPSRYRRAVSATTDYFLSGN